MVKFNHDPATQTLVCVFSGSMDTGQSSADAGAVAAALDRAGKTTAAPPAKPLRVVFDLQDVDYVSSAFFRICLATAKQVRKGNFSVAHARPEVTKLLKIAGLDEFIAAL